MSFAQSHRRRLIALIVPFAAIGVSVTTAQPAQAASITKKCTTTLNGVPQPSYMVDSMFVTQSPITGGKWQYVVTRSPNRIVTYFTNTGSQRFMSHHIDTIMAFYAGTNYVEKTVNLPGNTTTFISTSSRLDFWMKAHVQDSAVNAYPTCSVYF